MTGHAPILVHAASRTQWTLLGRLAQRLAAAGEPVVLSHEGPPPSAAIPDLRGLQVADFDREAVAAMERHVSPWPERVVPPRWRARVLGTPAYRRFLDLHRTRLSAARDVVARLRPRLLVVPEDGVSANAWLIRAVREAGRRVLVVPYGFGSRRDLDNALEQKHRAGDLILATGP